MFEMSREIDDKKTKLSLKNFHLFKPKLIWPTVQGDRPGIIAEDPGLYPGVGETFKWPHYYVSTFNGWTTYWLFPWF